MKNIGRDINRAAIALLVTALISMPALAQQKTVNIQIVNPDAQTAIRVFLDRKVIYETDLQHVVVGDDGPLPIVVGSFAIKDGAGRHVLTAEAPVTHAKGQLEWIPQDSSNEWVIVRYYPGRSDVEEPPFFTFSLQHSKTMLK